MPWLTTTLETSKYLAARATSGDIVQAWVAELDLKRRDLAAAQDLTALEVPAGILEPWECVAILQTLLHEAGFEFVNLIPAWTTAAVAKVAESLVQGLVGDAQTLLTAEFIEWKQLTAGTKFRIRSALEARTEPEHQPTTDVQKEDEDGDSLMTDYELDLLGRVYCLRLKFTGLRLHRSPAASAAEKPEPKRVRGYESSAGTPSEVSIRDSTLEDMSIQTPSAQVTSGQDSESTGRPASDPVPNIVGVTDDSSLGATSESYVSRNSSTDSSFGNSAAPHMPFAGHGQMVMSARAPTGVSAGTGAMGFHVTRQFIPGLDVKASQDDTIMAESVVSTKTSKTRTSRRSRRQSDWSSSSESDSSDDRHQVPWSEKIEHYSRDRSPSRRSDQSRRSYRSGRSRRSSVSVRSGPAEVAENALHQVQKLNEMVRKLEEKISTPGTVVPDAEVLQRFEEAARAVRESEQQAQEAERRLYEASVQASQGKQTVQAAQANRTPDVEALVEAARLQATQTERERLEAAAVQLVRDRQAEAEAQLTSERAAWAEQDLQNKEAMRLRLEAIEAERQRERESALNMQRFQASQIRDLQASNAQAKLEQTAPSPDPAIVQRGDNLERTTSWTGVNTGNASSVRTATGQKNLSEVALAQLSAIIPGATVSWLPQSSSSQTAKPEGSADVVPPKSTKSQASRATISRTQAKPTMKEEATKETKKSDKRKKPPKKSRRRDDSPSSSDSSSSSSSDDDDSLRSDSSNDDRFTSVVTPGTSKTGATLLSVRPYVNSATLEKFDEKASHGDRRSWWERLSNMASQAGWSERTKLSELKMKMSSAVRNWRGQLSKHVQQDWSKLSKAFRKKDATPEADRYFTMKQKSAETALEFLYIA